MSRRAVIAGAVTVALGVAGITTWQVLEESGSDPAPAAVAASLSAALRSATDSALQLSEPHRCARLLDRASPGGEPDDHAEGGQAGDSTASETGATPPDGAGAPAHGTEIVAGDQRWRVDGVRVHRDPPPGSTSASSGAGRVTIGVVADARGEARHLATVRKSFRQLGVELVVSLGGMGRDRDQIAGTLEPLSAPETWLLVAIPGDRESVAGHRAAVAGLSERAVIDGSRVRIVTAAPVSLVTLPGAPHVERLLAGPEGCLHDRDDARQVAEILREQPGIEIFASHVPPRQRRATASDLSAAGIHIGEPWLGDVVRESGAHVVIHGLIAAPGMALRGAHDKAEENPAFLAAGALDGLPTLSSVATRPAASWRRSDQPVPLALVLVVDGEQITWQRLVQANTSK